MEYDNCTVPSVEIDGKIMRDCLFATIKVCHHPSDPSLVPITEKRIISVKNASKRRRDGLHMKIEDEKYYCHSSCVKSYTSEQHIARLLKRELPVNDERPETKKLGDHSFHSILKSTACFVVNTVT